MTPGQDSFLDVVANLVGILIILVIVIGVRAKDAARVSAARLAAAIEAPAEPPPPTTDLDEVREALDRERTAAEDALRREHQVEDDMRTLVERESREQAEIAYRRAERDRMQLLVVAAERALEEARFKLTDQQRQQVEAAKELADAERELEEARRRLTAVESQEGVTEVIDHLPTPMARTVLGKELHFRLLGGRIAHVPMEQLIERFQEDIQARAPHMTGAKLTGSVGPIEGFQGVYVVERRQFQPDVLVEMVPVEDNLGEPVASALSGPSRFQNIVMGQDPRRTTVTLWTYPDSFEDFRVVKQWLFERKFLTACRPMPAGQNIGAAQDGTKSAAQ